MCKNFTTEIGTENVITPFWQRLPHFFVYPANLSSLGVMAVIAMLSALSFRASLFGVLLEIVLFFAFLRYAYAVLLHTALGRPMPPPLSRETLLDSIELPLKQAFVFIAMSVLTGVAYGLFGAFEAQALGLAFLSAVPATVVIIASDRSFLRALNPVVLAGIVRRVGWSYLVLCFFLLLLWVGSSTAVSIFFGQLPDTAFVALYAFASMYLLLMLFNMMGYVLHQFRERPGFAVDLDGDGTGQAPAADPIAIEVNLLVTEGKIVEAIARLEEVTPATPGEHGVHQRLHELLKLARRREDMVRHAHEWLPRLLGDQRYPQALDLIRDCLPVDPEFRPHEAAQIYPLATFAHRTHRGQIALRILSGFARRYPGHADIPRAYLLAARLLCETAKRDAQAKKLLEDLLRRYPQHELAPAIENYLGVVNRLIAQPGAR